MEKNVRINWNGNHFADLIQCSEHKNIWKKIITGSL